MKTTRTFLSILTVILISQNLGAQDDGYVKHIFKDHKESVLSVAFSPDGSFLVSGGDDKCLYLYDLATLELAKEFCDNYFPTLTLEVTALNQIFLGSGSDIKLVDADNKTLTVLSGNSTHIWSLDYAPERNKVAAGSYDYQPKVWDVNSGQMELELEGHKKSVLPIAFSPDEKYLVSGSLDKTLKLWNAGTGELMRTMERHTDNIYDIAFHPSGKYFASASRDKTIRLWDFESGEVLRTYSGHDKGVMSIAFLPDGNHLVSASLDGSIRLWQVKTGKMVYTFTGHEGAVNTLAVNEQGTLMASGGADSKVFLWDLSKKIFVEYAFYDEFYSDKEATGLFDEKRKGEKKEEYEARMEEARIKEAEIVERYYEKYLAQVRELKISR
ncbi:MAG: WD40 repeat domain-containing protein [Bacteroidales bacterium]|nr:WD40 repeat domain-containing protein [Bacteroidales bacterium]